MVPRARRGQRDVEGSTRRRMQRTPGNKEAIPMHLADGILLAHYEKGRSKICKEMPWLPSASKFDPYPPVELTEHGHPMAFPHFGA